MRLSSSTLLNMALAGEAKAKAKAKDLFFKAKAKASYFQGQGSGQGLKSLAMLQPTREMQQPCLACSRISSKPEW